MRTLRHAERRWVRGVLAALCLALSAGCGKSSTEPDPGGGNGGNSGGSEATTGSLTVTVDGLPSGAVAQVTVSGPGSYSRSVIATSTIPDLVPGDYTITAANVTSGSDLYAPDDASTTATVVAGQTASTTVTYAKVPRGTLQVTVNGLPTNIDADITVSDGGSFSELVRATKSFVVTPGDYTVVASEVANGIFTRTPSPSTQTVTVTDGGTTTATVEYAVVLGSLSFTVQGLPTGVDADVSVTGPSGFDQAYTASASLTDLTPGDYTIDAGDVTDAADTYSPVPSTQTVTVASGASESASIAYAKFELGTDINTVSAGSGYECALDASSAVKCWGEQTPDGWFGYAGSGAASVPSPTALVGANVPPFVEIATGGDHQCGLTASGEAYCWGDNTYGQLGDGGNDSRIQPAPVPGGSFSHISASRNTTCGLTISGQAYCWGENFLGMIGDGTWDDRAAPTLVVGNHLFNQIVVGGQHVCALDLDGRVWCWGGNLSGELGLGFTGTYQSPIWEPYAADTPETFVRLTKANGAHQCALEANGDAYCWGSNQNYQLGSPGISLADRTRPHLVPGGHKWKEIVAGGAYTCGIDGAGQLWCWGSNLHGELGLGDTDTRSALTLVPTSGLTWDHLILGPTTACAVTTTGKLYCWGENVFGAVGDGTSGNNRLVPTEVLPIG